MSAARAIALPSARFGFCVTECVFVVSYESFVCVKRSSPVAVYMH